MPIFYLTCPFYPIAMLSQVPSPVPAATSVPLRIQLERAHANKKSVKAAAACHERFLTFCTARGLRTSPPTYESVGDFLTDYFTQHKNRASSIGGVLSQLRTQYRARSEVFLSPGDEQRITHLRQQLNIADTTGVRRVSPLRFSLLRAALGLMDLTRPGPLQEATMVAFAQNALLRTAEVTAGIRAEHVTWFHDMKGLVIRIPGPTKTSQHGCGITIEVRESSDPLSGLALLHSPGRVCLLCPAEGHSAPHGQSIGRSVSQEYQTDGRLHRSGPFQVLRTLSPGGRGHGPLRCRPALLHHSEDGTVEVGCGDALLPLRGGRGVRCGQSFRRRHGFQIRGYGTRVVYDLH